MRPTVPRFAKEAPVDELFPAFSDAVPGPARLHPLLRAVLGIQELGWHGTIFVRDEAGQTACVLQAHAGWLVVGPTENPAHTRGAALSACEAGNARVTVAADSGNASKAACRLDPLALAADIVRAGMADDVVSESVEAIGHKALKLRARVDLERYGLTPEESELGRCLQAGARTLAELAQSVNVPKSSLRRFAFLLWATRAVDVVPVWLRTAGEAPARNDEPTAVVRTSIAARSFTPRESARVPVRRTHAPPSRPSIASPGAYQQQSPHDACDDIGREPANTRTSEPEDAFEITARDQADYHFHAARVLVERGYAREAVFEAQKALRVCSPSPNQRALYAWLLYARSGLTPGVEACIREHLRLALAEDPGCERAHDVIARISRWR